MKERPLTCKLFHIRSQSLHIAHDRKEAKTPFTPTTNSEPYRNLYGPACSVRSRLFGTVPLVRYSPACSERFRLFGTVPLVWYGPACLERFRLFGTVPLVWYGPACSERFRIRLVPCKQFLNVFVDSHLNSPKLYQY